MTVHELILKRRSIRKFSQKPIEKKVLLDCLVAARMAPSAANLQPLEYILVTEKEKLHMVFGCTKWAGYLKDGTPKDGERPLAYILIVSNQQISKNAKYDVGLAAENIMLAALEKGVASCVLGALDRPKLVEVLGIPASHTIELAIALGYPAQKSLAEDFKGDVKYWLDVEGTLHVPKRRLEDIVHEEEF